MQDLTEMFMFLGDRGFTSCWLEAGTNTTDSGAVERRVRNLPTYYAQRLGLRLLHHRRGEHRAIDLRIGLCLIQPRTDESAENACCPGSKTMIVSTVSVYLPSWRFGNSGSSSSTS